MKHVRYALLAAACLLWQGADASADSKQGGVMTHVPQQQQQQGQSPNTPATMTHIDPGQFTQDAKDVPQIDPGKVPSPGKHTAPNVVPDAPPAGPGVAGFQTPDHLLEDSLRMRDGQQGMSDARYQDAVRGLFGAAEAGPAIAPTERFGEVGTVKPRTPGMPGKDSSLDAIGGGARDLAGSGQRATGTRTFSPRGQEIIQARVNQLALAGYEVVNAPSPGRAEGTFTDYRGNYDNIVHGRGEANVTQIVIVAYHTERSEFIRVSFVERTGNTPTNNQRTLGFDEYTTVFDVVGGRATESPKERIFNHWDGIGQQVSHTRQRGEGAAEKPEGAEGKDTDTASSGSSGSGDKDTDTSSSGSSDSGGKDTSADSGDTGDKDTSSTDSAAQDGKDAAADAKDTSVKGWIAGPGTTGGDDPRGGETAVGTPASLPGLSQRPDTVQFVDLSQHRLVDTEDLATDPSNSGGQGGGAGAGIAVMAPTSFGPGANPGEARSDHQAPRLGFTPEDLISDPIPEDIVGGPGQ